MEAGVPVSTSDRGTEASVEDCGTACSALSFAFAFSPKLFSAMDARVIKRIVSTNIPAIRPNTPPAACCIDNNSIQGVASKIPLEIFRTLVQITDILEAERVTNQRELNMKIS